MAQQLQAQLDLVASFKPDLANNEERTVQLKTGSLFPQYTEILVPNWNPTCPFTVSAIFKYLIPKETFNPKLHSQRYELYSGTANLIERKFTGGRSPENTRPGKRPEEYGYKMWYKPEYPDQNNGLYLIGSIVAQNFSVQLETLKQNNWAGTEEAQRQFNNTVPNFLPFVPLPPSRRSMEPYLPFINHTVFLTEYDQAQDQFGRVSMAWQTKVDRRDNVFKYGEQGGNIPMLAAILSYVQPDQNSTNS